MIVLVFLALERFSKPAAAFLPFLMKGLQRTDHRNATDADAVALNRLGSWEAEMVEGASLVDGSIHRSGR